MNSPQPNPTRRQQPLRGAIAGSMRIRMLILQPMSRSAAVPELGRYVMKRPQICLVKLGLLFVTILLSGCATVPREDGRSLTSTENSENSPWIDPDATPDYDNMTVAEKVGYVAWWPFLQVAKGFCS